MSDKDAYDLIKSKDLNEVKKYLEDLIKNKGLKEVLDSNWGEGNNIFNAACSEVGKDGKELPLLLEETLKLCKNKEEIEVLIEGFDSYMEREEAEIWDEPSVYTSVNEDGEEDYRYETDPDEWIREIIPIDEWDNLQELISSWMEKHF